jgi:hypothetical protein
MRAARSDARLLTGTWWRFAAYQLVGRRICRARDARLEQYDPWAGKGKGQPRPYVELARLGEQITAWYERQVRESIAVFQEAVPVPSDPTLAELAVYARQAQVALAGGYATTQQLPAEIGAPILAFCGRWGLLGIFAQETLAVNTGARPETLLDLPDELAEDDLISKYARYERCGSDWRSFTRRQREQVAKGSCPGLRRRSIEWLVAQDDWPLDESHLRGGSVLRRVLPAQAGLPAALDLAGLGEVKGAYLGDSRGGSLPEPHSPQFWQDYAEDVVSFARYAVTLAAALDGLQHGTAAQRAPHLERFNELLAPVSLEIIFEKKMPVARFASPSLIATLAAMAFFDIKGGVRFGHCARPGCGRLFSTTRSDRLYCSRTCQQHAKHKRRLDEDAAYRKRKREEAKLRMRRQRATRAAQDRQS